jgi:hypothetical protein
MADGAIGRRAAQSQSCGLNSWLHTRLDDAAAACILVTASRAAGLSGPTIRLPQPLTRLGLTGQLDT